MDAGEELDLQLQGDAVTFPVVHAVGVPVEDAASIEILAGYEPVEAARSAGARVRVCSARRRTAFVAAARPAADPYSGYFLAIAARLLSIIVRSTL